MRDSELKELISLSIFMLALSLGLVTISALSLAGLPSILVDDLSKGEKASLLMVTAFMAVYVLWWMISDISRLADSK